MNGSGAAALLTSALLSACTTTLWHPWIEKQQGTVAQSEKKALVHEPAMFKPGPAVPPDQARWWGHWYGWFGYERATDTKIVVSRFEKNGDVIIGYSWKSDSGSGGSATIIGTFSGKEINAKLSDGSSLSLRMRENGNEIEIARRTGRGEIPMSFFGLLARQPEVSASAR